MLSNTRAIALLALTVATLATPGSIVLAQQQDVARKIVAPIIVPLLLSADAGPPPGVTTVTPANGKTSVNLDTTSERIDASGLLHKDVVSAIFNKRISSNSVNNATFKLSRGGADVAATVILDDAHNQAKLGTDKTLALLTQYTATLTSSITDLSGNPLPATNWSFTSRDGTWLPAEKPLDQFSVGLTTNPRVAVNAGGDAIAVWEQSDGTRKDIWSSRYEPGRGWDRPGLVEADTTFSASNPQVAIDDNDNAIVVWERADEALSASSIWAKRYVAGGGWGTPEALEGDAGAARKLRIAGNAAGEAIAVWSQDDDLGVTSIWANRYVPESGWIGPESLESDAVSNTYEAQVAINDAGVAFVVWEQEDAAFDFATQIWANRFVPNGSGWGRAQRIERDPYFEIEDARIPQIAVDGAGNAIVVFEQDALFRDPIGVIRIWWSRYVPGAGWSLAEYLGDGGKPRIAMNTAGNAFMAYEFPDACLSEGELYPIIFTSGYAPASGWNLVKIEQACSHRSEHQVAIDDAGHGVGVYAVVEGGSNFVNAYRLQLGQNGPLAYPETRVSATGAIKPQIVADGFGNILVVWGKEAASVQTGIGFNRFGGGGEPNGQLISAMAFSDPSLGECIRAAAAANSWHFAQEVRSLDCSNRSIRSLGGLETFVNLESLNLSSNRLDDISVFARMQLLTSIDLQGNRGLSNIDSLIGLPNLNVALLAATGIDAGIDCADLDALSQSNDGVVVVPPFTCRQRIADAVPANPPLQNCASRAAAREGLTYVDELTELNCKQENGQLAFFVLDGVQVFQNLEAINISGSSVADLAPLAGLPKLKRIDASSTFLTNLAPLQGAATLEVLVLKAVARLYREDLGEDPTGLSILSSMPSLREVYLGQRENCLDTGQIGACVTGGGKLECLSLDALEGTLPIFERPRRCNMSLDAVLLETPDANLRQCIDDMRRGLFGDINLFYTDEILSLSCPDMGISQLKGVQRFGRMNTLIVDGNPISDLAPLNGMVNLQELNVSRTNLQNFDTLNQSGFFEDNSGVLPGDRGPYLLARNIGTLTDVHELLRLSSLHVIDLSGSGTAPNEIPCAELDALQILVDNFANGQLVRPAGCSGGSVLPPSEDRSMDVNADGIDDLVLQFDATGGALLTAHWDTALSTSAQFTIAGNLPGFDTAIYSRVRAVGLGDADADGDDDLLLQLDSAVDDSVEWRAQLSDGAGGYGASTSPVSLPFGRLDNAHAIAFNDVDGDGNADILIEQQLTMDFAPFSVNAVQYLLSMGNGTGYSAPVELYVFPLFIGDTVLGWRPNIVALEDINNDGAADLIYDIVSPLQLGDTHCFSVRTYPFKLDAGAANCTPVPIWRTQVLDAVSVADVDGDDRKELVLSIKDDQYWGPYGTFGDSGYQLVTLALDETSVDGEKWGNPTPRVVIAPNGIKEFRTVGVADINNDRRADVLVEVTDSNGNKEWIVSFPRPCTDLDKVDTQCPGVVAGLYFDTRTVLSNLPLSAEYRAIGLRNYVTDSNSVPDLLFLRKNPTSGIYSLHVGTSNILNSGSFLDPATWYSNSVRPGLVGLEEEGLTALANDTSELIAWAGVADLYYTSRQFSAALAEKGLDFKTGANLDPAEPLGKDECVVGYTHSESEGNIGDDNIGGEASFGLLVCNIQLGDRASLKMQAIYGGCSGTTGLAGAGAKCEVGVFSETLAVDLTPSFPPGLPPVGAELNVKAPNASACGSVSKKNLCAKVGADLASVSGSASVAGSGVGGSVAVGVGAGIDGGYEDGVISGSIEAKLLIGFSIDFKLDPVQTGEHIYRLGENAYTFAGDGADFIVYTAGPEVYDAASKAGGAILDAGGNGGKVALSAAGEAVYFFSGANNQIAFFVFPDLGGSTSELFAALEGAALVFLTDPEAAIRNIANAIGSALDDVFAEIADWF